MSQLTPGSLSWQQLTREATSKLSERYADDRTHEARWLVERVSGYSSAELLVHGAENVSARAVALFDQLLARRLRGEPLQYVLGRWSFRSLELLVDQRVLIPRPETEGVAGLGIDHLRTYQRPVRAVDLGCGSGAIGLSIATEVPNAKVWMSDLSADALAVASANLAGLGMVASNVTLCEGSWFDSLPQGMRASFDLVISNPPYVPNKTQLPVDVVDHEPHIALFGGEHGGEFLELIVDESRYWLAPGGCLVLEMSPEQTEQIAQRCRDVGFRTARIEQDLAGKARAVVARI